MNILLYGKLMCYNTKKDWYSGKEIIMEKYKNMRDDFTQATKDILANRVGWKCSNPNCRRATRGAGEKEKDIINIGVAAHITAASESGPRYDKNISIEKRKSFENGIWLCQSCAKLIDSDVQRYTVELLVEWKKSAEEKARLELEKINNRVLQDDNIQTNRIQDNTFAAFIDSIQMRSNYTGLLHYQNKQIGLYGREKEIRRIREFMDYDDKIALYVLCGAAGMGKSKLIYSFFAQQCENTDWKMIFINYTLFKRIVPFMEYIYTKNLFFAIDNVGKFSVEFAEWLAFILNLKENYLPVKWRILLIEREGICYEDRSKIYPAWYQNIVDIIDANILQSITYNYAFDMGFIKLHGLKRADISRIISDYIIADSNQIDKEIVYEKNSFYNESNELNPLYCIMKFTAISRDIPEIGDYFYEDIDSYLKRISRIDKLLYDNLQLLIIYTTIIEPWEIGKEERLPNFFKNAAYYILDNIDEMDLVRLICHINGKEVFDGYLSNIEPDLVGEIVVIKYLRKRSMNRQQFKNIIMELTRDYANKFIQFVSNCYCDLISNSYFEKTMGESVECLKELNEQLCVEICSLMTVCNYFLKMNIVYLLKEIGKIEWFDKKCILKVEIFKLFYEDKLKENKEVVIDNNMMYNIILLRESQRTINDVYTNPVYLERTALSLKKWGFSDEISNIAEKSSIYIVTEKSIESYIVSLVDIFVEKVMEYDVDDDYSISKTLNFIDKNLYVLKEDEISIKNIFFDFIMGR